MHNPWFNKTAGDFNNGSALNSLDNESLTQDSLFINRDDLPGSATGNVRASLAKTQGPVAAVGMSMSS